MSQFYFPLIVLLTILAIVLREDHVFTVLYLFAGAYLASLWWSRTSLGSIQVVRNFSKRAFLNEEVPVELELANTGYLPVPWLRLNEALSVELLVPNFFRCVISLGSKEQLRLHYTLRTRKRGYYPIGPLALTSGDLLGMTGPVKTLYPLEYITVYPKIIPLSNIPLSSHSPMGTLRHHEPIFEDPTRIRGKRDYVAGDSLRRIDWKSTAVTGRLQVKLFEPSIALETMLFLDLGESQYLLKDRLQATELAIVVAASIASWVVSKKQSVGLVTNGVDPLAADGPPHPLLPRKGRGQLIRVLEALARLQTTEAEPLTDIVRRVSANLPWGTTLILITGQVGENLFDELFQARRSGLDSFLVLCGTGQRYSETRRQAEYFGFPVFHFADEQDLDVWR